MKKILKNQAISLNILRGYQPQVAASFSLLLFIIFIIPSKIEAQRRPTGLLVNDSIYNKTHTLLSFEGVKYNNIPLTFSLRQHCPTVGDQYSTSTCVGWSVGYGALTITRAAVLGMKNRDSIDRIAHSAFYIYNRIATDCNVGAELSAALNLVHTEGDCLSRTFGNDIKNCEKKPTETATHEAQNYKIKDYIAVFKIDDAPNVKIKKMQQTLAASNPVVVAMNVTNSFYAIKNGDEFWQPTADERGIEAHAMVVVGYDAVKGWFELMNSWGNRWGDSGFIKVKTADFTRFVQYAYQILPEDRVLLRGSFSFRTVKNGGDVFEDAKVKFDAVAKTYKTEQATWQVGNIFQLVAHHLPKGKYVYVFSLDAQNQLNTHYPFGEHAEFMPSNDAEIVIPDAESAMQISHAGEDNLFVLYADHAIVDFKERLKKMETITGDVQKRLKIGFEDILITDKNVKFNDHEMQCEVVGETIGKYVVAMVLSVKSVN